MILLYILFTYFLINLLFFVKRLDNKTKPRIELKKTQIVTYAFSNRYITVENNKIYLLLFLILGPISYFFCDKIKNKRTISILKEEIVNIKLNLLSKYISLPKGFVLLVKLFLKIKEFETIISSVKINETKNIFKLLIIIFFIF